MNKITSHVRHIFAKRSFLAILILALTVGLAVAVQQSEAGKNLLDEPAKETETDPQNDNIARLELPSNKPKNYVTSDDDGGLVVINLQTGQQRQLSDDEAKRLADGLKQMINDSTEGLVEVRHEDGMVSMDLKGHLHDVMVARREDDGTITYSCINNLEAAAAFFQIDPNLLGVQNSAAQFKPLSTKLEER